MTVTPDEFAESSHGRSGTRARGVPQGCLKSREPTKDGIRAWCATHRNGFPGRLYDYLLE